MSTDFSQSSAFGLLDAGEGFVAGALSVLIFQMGAAAILHGLGLTPNTPYAMTATTPLGVPQTLSAAFWGGLWGIVLLVVLRRSGQGWRYWLTAAIFGSLIVGGTLLAIVLPLKGRPFAAGWDPKTLIIVLCLHAVFGLGTAIFIRGFDSLRR